MSEDLNLRLHREGPGKKGTGRTAIVFLVLVLLVAVANLVLQLGAGGRKGPSGIGLSTEKLEDLALKFEKQHLPGAAARAWIDYLEAARPGAGESARIWYRIGKIYQDNGDYERALEAYYRSEGLAELDETEAEISRRTAECLENMGKFAALQLELESRTSFLESDSTGGSEIIAEIGSWKISRSEIDILMEAEIDAQLSQLAGSLSPDERRAQKEKILETVLRQGGRAMWLERFIAEELLYRCAREEKLYEEPEIRSLMRNVERKILAQKLLDRRYASSITVTPDELRSYYDANPDEFKEDDMQKDFDEVTDKVYSAVRARKEMEVQRRVLEKLKRRYDVVIHLSKPGSL